MKTTIKNSQCDKNEDKLTFNYLKSYRKTDIDGVKKVSLKYIKLKDNNRVSMVTNGLKVATAMDGYFAEKAPEHTHTHKSYLNVFTNVGYCPALI